MSETISKRQADGRNHTYNRLVGFRCKECHGHAYANHGRVQVAHAKTCSIFIRLHLTYPRFSRTLQLYRALPY